MGPEKLITTISRHMKGDFLYGKTSSAQSKKYFSFWQWEIIVCSLNFRLCFCYYVRKFANEMHYTDGFQQFALPFVFCDCFTQVQDSIYAFLNLAVKVPETIRQILVPIFEKNTVEDKPKSYGRDEFITVGRWYTCKHIPSTLTVFLMLNIERYFRISPLFFLFYSM